MEDGRNSFAVSFIRSLASLYRENIIPQWVQVSEAGCSNLHLGHCIIHVQLAFIKKPHLWVKKQGLLTLRVYKGRLRDTRLLFTRSPIHSKTNQSIRITPSHAKEEKNIYTRSDIVWLSIFLSKHQRPYTLKNCGTTIQGRSRLVLINWLAKKIKMNMIKIARNISYLYVCLLIISFLTSFILQFPSFDDVGHLKKGCYWTDALVPFIECNGLIANYQIKFFLNYWMSMIWYPLFLSPMALLMWSPIFYLIWYFFKGRHFTSAGNSPKWSLMLNTLRVRLFARPMVDLF